VPASADYRLPDPGADASPIPRSETTPAPGRAPRVGYIGLGAAVVQGACALLMTANSAKLLLGVGSVVAASGAQSILHSDPVRFTLMGVAAVAASMTLYVLWNARRLRRRPAAAWRQKTPSRRERWSSRIAFASAILSWVLIIGELIAHRILHP
jgi:membrane protein YqaA with SNARE-associated domain